MPSVVVTVSTTFDGTASVSIILPVLVIDRFLAAVPVKVPDPYCQKVTCPLA